MTGRIVHFQRPRRLFIRAALPNTCQFQINWKEVNIYADIYTDANTFTNTKAKQILTQILIIYQIQILIQQFQRAASCVTSIPCKCNRRKNYRKQRQMIPCQRYNDKKGTTTETVTKTNNALSFFRKAAHVQQCSLNLWQLITLI